jgi:S1-C subfamily serine protease
MTKETTFTQLSNSMAEAVEKASAFTVLVNARRRFPATGILYAKNLVLTADHVVQRDDEIEIMLPDGTKTAAVIKGRDPGHDLALLRIFDDADTFASPSEHPARVGQLVLSLGRPSDQGIQASLGVVSAVGGGMRQIRSRGGPGRRGRGRRSESQATVLNRFIRTDAIPYPGFSGGPLIDAYGNVLGVNTSGVFRGASVAIPVDHAWQIADSLEKHGGVKRGYLGVRMQTVAISSDQQTALGRVQEEGLLVIWLEPGAAASNGGLLVGDIIVGLDGNPVDSPDELQMLLTGEIVGQAAPIEILRGGSPMGLEITIGEME